MPEEATSNGRHVDEYSAKATQAQDVERLASIW